MIFVVYILLQYLFQYKVKSSAIYILDFLARHPYPTVLITTKLQTTTILCLVKESSVADAHIIYICLKTN